MGHLTRAIALARAIVRGSETEDPERPQSQICLLTNSPFADRLPLASELGSRHQVVAINPNLDRDETSRRVADLFNMAPFDMLVVDTFPRGLGGELADLLPAIKCPKVLVHRDLNPRYCEKFRLASFIQLYDRLLIPGESAPFDTFPHAVRTAPWLIRDHHELQAPAEARRFFGVESNAVPVVAVLGCGRAQEMKQMRDLAIRLSCDFESKAAVRFVTLESRPSDANSPVLNVIGSWPFFRAIRGVSLIVGGGGYNTVSEARATGTPLIGIPWPRLYDRQDRRLAPNEIARTFDEVRQQVGIMLNSNSQIPECPAPRYENGVHAAIADMEALFM